MLNLLPAEEQRTLRSMLLTLSQGGRLGLWLAACRGAVSRGVPCLSHRVRHVGQGSQQCDRSQVEVTRDQPRPLLRCR